MKKRNLVIAGVLTMSTLSALGGNVFAQEKGVSTSKYNPLLTTKISDTKIGSVLFSDNFNEGNFENWDTDGNPVLVSDGSNGKKVQMPEGSQLFTKSILVKEGDTYEISFDASYNNYSNNNYAYIMYLTSDGQQYLDPIWEDGKTSSERISHLTRAPKNALYMAVMLSGPSGEGNFHYFDNFSISSVLPSDFIGTENFIYENDFESSINDWHNLFNGEISKGNGIQDGNSLVVAPIDASQNIHIESNKFSCKKDTYYKLTADIKNDSVNGSSSISVYDGIHDQLVLYNTESVTGTTENKKVTMYFKTRESVDQLKLKVDSYGKTSIDNIKIEEVK